jgi:hypothetical protein
VLNEKVNPAFAESSFCDRIAFALLESLKPDCQRFLQRNGPQSLPEIRAQSSTDNVDLLHVKPTRSTRGLLLLPIALELT